MRANTAGGKKEGRVKIGAGRAGAAQQAAGNPRARILPHAKTKKKEKGERGGGRKAASHRWRFEPEGGKSECWSRPPDPCKMGGGPILLAKRIGANASQITGDLKY